MTNKIIELNTTSELELSQKLNQLDWDIQPERDLWPDISSQIQFTNRTRITATPWMPYAMAASVVLAIVALVFSSMTYQRSLDANQYQATLALYQESQIALIEQQHQMVRVQFSQLLKNERDSLNPDFVNELEMLMFSVDTASNQIKKALVTQPNNPNYTSMLVRTYQQEIKFLNTLRANRINPKDTELKHDISI